MDQLLIATKPQLSPPFFPTITIDKTTSPSSIFNSKSDLPPRTSFTHQDHPSFEQTQQIHAHFIKTQFHHAHQIPLPSFQIPLSSEAQFNFLITSYIKNKYPENALNLYIQMRRMDSAVDNFTIPSVLKACSQVSWVFLGKEIHGFSVKNGFAEDVFVCNALIQMYAECGSMVSARMMFDKMPKRDAVSWSTMMAGYGRSKLVDEALEVIREMYLVRERPNEMAMISMINLFADKSDMKMGKEIHGYIIRNGYNEYLGVAIVTALIDMYSKCGNLSFARRLYNGLAEKKGIVTWTAMIAGLIHNNKAEEGAKLFNRMLEDFIFPNEITMLSLVKECGYVGALEFGKWLHAHILRNGFDASLVLTSALIDMYGKCGEVKYARVLFDNMERKDVMIWSSMISAYARDGCINQAFDLFIKMKDCGIRPNKVTMVSLVSLCAETGALDLGKWIHAYIDHQGVEVDTILETALLDMYAKCGDVEKAYSLFSKSTQRDICTWNAMIAGFAMHGEAKEAIGLFLEMERRGVEPKDLTFIGILHACSHGGLVSEGKSLFRKMVFGLGLAPKIEHYGCMVDLLGRAGHLDEAYNIINHMPMRPTEVVWGALLAACKVHKNLKFAEVVVRKILEMKPENCGYNVLISNIYAAENRWEDVARVRKEMESKGIRKEPGLSSIEINGTVHDFTMGDQTHPQTQKIYKMLAEMSKKLKESGHVPNTSVVLLNIDEEEKETSLSHHSERLAMAFGLISTASGTPIRIVKNLRICDDCHSFTKLLSKIYGRKITVRDRNRFHHFSEGFCSCNDYW